MVGFHHFHNVMLHAGHFPQGTLLGTGGMVVFDADIVKAIGANDEFAAFFHVEMEMLTPAVSLKNIDNLAADIVTHGGVAPCASMSLSIIADWLKR